MDTLEDDVANITCEKGYVLSSHVSSVELVCQLNGMWTELMDTCIGKILKLTKYCN